MHEQHQLMCTCRVKGTAGRPTTGMGTGSAGTYQNPSLVSLSASLFDCRGSDQQRDESGAVKHLLTANQIPHKTTILEINSLALLAF